MNSTRILEVPIPLRRGAHTGFPKQAKSGALILDYMPKHLGYANLENLAVLDVGCGSKFTQAILYQGIPIGRYVGIDVFKELMEFLQAEVADERFEFHHVDIHNEMYNPDGMPLSELGAFPLPDASFDIICLYSVFTHLAPHDYPAMLRLLRPLIKPDGKIMYSLFVNELTEGGYGLCDFLSKSPMYGTKIRQGDTVPEFVDVDRENPLKWAVYSRDFALSLVQGTGWEVESLSNPIVDGQIQHHIVCRPV
ncbi:MAG: class I SAM-dependent methyltransferase [Haliea sp.]|nr:class I SAM-dependent methyltransferase [Haliea sp.]